MPSHSIFLVDNGSLRPDATFALRALASALSGHLDTVIEPVSLLHSHKIAAKDLAGEPATIVKRRMRELIAEGQMDFVILPLFLGPSLAITDYLPKVVEELRKKSPELTVRIALPLGGADVDLPDSRLALILKDHLDQLLKDIPDAEVALVDHGTPIRPVNQLRDAVAFQLSEKTSRVVQPCSMERREGPEYAFNEPLLENLASSDPVRKSLVLLMFFLLPGRHAGAGGDVAEIIEGLRARGNYDEIRVSPLMGEHPLLLELLRERLEAVL